MPDDDRPATTCARCGAVVPADEGWRPWCECGWNVCPSTARAEPQGRLARLYASLGRRHGAHLFEQVLRDGAERPSLGRAEAALIALSALVFVSWLAFPAAAVALAVARHDRPLAWVGVAILTLFAWVLRPRSWSPPDATEIAAATHPRLVALVTEVAAAVGAAPPRRILLTDDWNAAAGGAGVLRRPTLLLGVPLTVALRPQELVAVLGHEMGHFVNGDTTRGAFVGAAWDTLAGWCSVVAPDEWDAERGPAHRVAALMMWLLSWIPWLFVVAFVHLHWTVSQRAEYCADRLAAEAGGSGAATGLLERLLDADLLTHALHRVVVARSARPPLTELRALLDELPARERERRRRAAAEEPTSLDATHPPTGLRIRRVREGSQPAPRVTLDDAGHAEILRELAPSIDRTNARLADRHRDSLYQ